MYHQCSAKNPKMTTKIVTIFAVVILGFQAMNCRVHKVDGAFDDIIEAAEEVLRNATVIADELIQDAKNGINEVVKDLDDVTANADKYIKQLIDAEFSELNKLIDDLKNHTDGVMEEVLQCVEDVESDISDVETYTLNASLLCVGSAEKKFLTDTELILDDLDDIVVNQLAPQADELDKCKNKLIPVECIEGVVNNIIDIVSNIPSVCADDIAKVEDDLANLEKTVVQCVQDILPVVEEKAAHLFEDYTQCVNKQK